MIEFQEKRRLKKLLYSKVTIVVLLIIIVLTINAVRGVYEKHLTTKDNLAKTAASLEGLQARERMLSTEIERLKTTDGAEIEIREKYGLVKPGEEVLVVVDSDSDDKVNQASNPISFWQKVLDWLR
jgi:cell division protein FtsB